MSSMSNFTASNDPSGSRGNVPQARSNGLGARTANEAGATADEQQTVASAEPAEQPQANENTGQDTDNAQKEETTQTQEPGTENKDSSTAEQSPPVQDINVVPGQALRLVVAASDSEQPDSAKEHPQIKLQKFWANFEPDYQGGVTQILPKALLHNPPVSGVATTVTNNYSQAREKCIKSVQKIAQECRALNQKYTDIHFDLEKDLKLTGEQDCLYCLGSDQTSPPTPRQVKRVTEIYKAPQFFKDGAGYDDIIQGQLGDCWFLSGLSAITANEQLLRDVCVIQDQEVGIYGFVFYRDGEWQPCIIDDKLYLLAPSFDESPDTVLNMYGVNHKDQEKKYHELFQTGSNALHFGACRDENETWVPLLEKAYAKAHGDYESLEGGQTGEALEDLTGGVTTEIYTNNILSKDRFWNDKLRRTGQTYLFSCGRAAYSDWRDASDDEGYWNHWDRQKGIVEHHAYAVLGTYDGFGQRLVKIRNPWGKSEWNGAWSDGSKEWTATWMQRLNHQFGDDGIFWISYEDMLNRYSFMDCTRIFGPEWYVAQQWTKVQVPWSITDYQQTKFNFDLPAPSEVVIVLSQLDGRYFVGLEGQYIYELHFRLHKDGNDENDYITRSRVNYELRRSVNIELELEAGSYTVLFKLVAHKITRDDIETVLRKEASRRAKITQIATLYDLAQAKGMPAKPDGETPVAAESNGGSKKAEPTTSSQSNVNDESGKDETKKDDKEGTAGEAKDQPAETKAVAKEAEDDPKDDATETEGQSESSVKPKSNDDDPQRDAWNAFCTVGLRVYSKVPEMQLNVVEPVKEKPAPLDRDDIAKSAASGAEVASALNGEKKDTETDTKPDATATTTTTDKP